MVSIAIPRATCNLRAYIWACDVNDNVTTHVVLSIGGVKQVRSIIRQLYLSAPNAARSRRGCVKRQKLTFDLSLVGNVRGRNRPPAGHERSRGNSSVRLSRTPFLPSQKIEWYDADEYKRSLSVSFLIIIVVKCDTNVDNKQDSKSDSDFHIFFRLSIFLI